MLVDSSNCHSLIKPSHLLAIVQYGNPLVDDAAASQIKALNHDNFHHIAEFNDGRGFENNGNGALPDDGMKVHFPIVGPPTPRESLDRHHPNR